MNETSKIFIVVGQTGEYSDHFYWFVAAYTDEESAKTHVELANARCRELGVGGNENWSRPAKRLDFGPLDPSFNCDYTGTWYVLEEVDLLATVPGRGEVQ